MKIGWKYYFTNQKEKMKAFPSQVFFKYFLIFSICKVMNWATAGKAFITGFQRFVAFLDL
jgi:hypothetical protein